MTTPTNDEAVQTSPVETGEFWDDTIKSEEPVSEPQTTDTSSPLTPASLALLATVYFHAADCGRFIHGGPVCTCGLAARLVEVEEQAAHAAATAAALEGVRQMSDDRAQLQAADAQLAELEGALTDCLHRLGNMWPLFGIPPSDWKAIFDAADRGDPLPQSGTNAYSMALNYLAYKRGERALNSTAEDNAFFQRIHERGEPTPSSDNFYMLDSALPKRDFILPCGHK